MSSSRSDLQWVAWAQLMGTPCGQDGSCNGLQHYAALGRDSVGAASVNLLPSDLPQDVYREVAAQVGARAFFPTGGCFPAVPGWCS